MESVDKAICRHRRFGRLHVVVLILGISSSLAHEKSQAGKGVTAAQAGWVHGGDMECVRYAICPGCTAVKHADAQKLLSGECSTTFEQDRDPRLECNGSQYSQDLLNDLQQGFCLGGCTSQAKQLCTTQGRTLLEQGKLQASHIYNLATRITVLPLEYFCD